MFGRAAFVVVILAAGAASADTAHLRTPARITAQVVDRVNHQEKHQKLNHLSVATKGLVQTGQHDSPSRLRSFPTWHGSFTSAGTNYPYVMAGRAPQRGDETEIDTSLIVLSFRFFEFGDAQGNPIVIESQSIVDDFLGSPNFVKSEYSVGRGQFGDAVQRASFYNIAERDWHTTLERPRILIPVRIDVPVGMAQLYDLGNGKFVGIVNFDFLYSQIQTILQLENIKTNELPILLSHNVFADQALGFHDAIEVTSGNHSGIQTYTWSSWLDADAFGDIFADATTLTHEISEWIADPFTNNPTPDWQIPESGGFCSNILEVGDPIEFLASQMFPITLHGHVYHTQNEAMLSWFSREVPSSAFQGAYSYPNTSSLTAPSQPCGTP
jgi:hypothetical protein